MLTSPVQGVTASVSTPSINTNVQSGDAGFSKYLSNALDDANSLSNQADKLSAVFAAGGPVTVDQLMIAEQKASLAVDLVVQVRNRVVSAYQSIMNMQI